MGKTITRDTLKENAKVLEAAIRFLGLRVSVPTCQVHVRELYKFMGIDCPSHLTSLMDIYCQKPLTSSNVKDSIGGPNVFFKTKFMILSMGV